MAKDNLFLGMARGKVGDVVFSRLNGVQVTRARNRAPRNPQSPAQMVQRIIMSTVGKAYSFMQGICDHSFEGFETGQLSQRKFMEVNVGLLRDKAATVLAYPVEEVVRASTAYNFSFKNDYSPVLNSFMLSAGSLPSIQLVSLTDGYSPAVPLNLPAGAGETPTYADIVAALGLQRGDQLTFVTACRNNRYTGHDADLLTGFEYARIIMEPASGDMTVPFLSGSQVNDPNERNTGNFSELTIQAAGESTPAQLKFYLQNVYYGTALSDRAHCAYAVIVSRQVGGRWLRSTQFLLPRFASGQSAMQASTLGLAYETYRLSASSDLYLNQAE